VPPGETNRGASVVLHLRLLAPEGNVRFPSPTGSRGRSATCSASTTPPRGACSPCAPAWETSANWETAPRLLSTLVSPWQHPHFDGHSPDGQATQSPSATIAPVLADGKHLVPSSCHVPVVLAGPPLTERSSQARRHRCRIKGGLAGSPSPGPLVESCGSPNKGWRGHSGPLAWLLHPVRALAGSPSYRGARHQRTAYLDLVLVVSSSVIGVAGVALLVVVRDSSWSSLGAWRRCWSPSSWSTPWWSMLTSWS
jgi:hypothetical protein